MPRGGVPTRPPRTRSFTFPRREREKEIAYEMSGGRKFHDSGRQRGVYAGAAGAARLLEDGSQRLLEDDNVRFLE